MTNHVLKIEGAVHHPLTLGWYDLEQFPAADRVPDVSVYQPSRAGTGIELDAILKLAQVHDDADHATLHADQDDFHASIPLHLLRGQGIVVYRLGNVPLPAEKGGPIRLIIREPSACHTGELDDCANVKFLSRIELTRGRGRDNRPADENQHQALHLPEST